MNVTQFQNQQPVRESDQLTVVMDGKDLCPGKCEEDVLNGRQQIDVLQKLVKIQEAEDWDIWVLFNGEPLHQVDHGGDFMGIRVFFSPTPPQRIPTLLECVKVLKKKGRNALLISNDVTLEERAREQGAFTLRADTLKKGFEPLFVVKGRPQSRLMRHRTVDRKKDSIDSGQRSIHDMIDLVDEP